jgi:hypothetical protein
MTQLTLGPVHVGASICVCRIKQRHDPQLLSTALQSLSALHARLAATGVPGVFGCDPFGSGAPGAEASSSAGAFMPDDPERITGAPT